METTQIIASFLGSVLFYIILFKSITKNYIPLNLFLSCLLCTVLSLAITQSLQDLIRVGVVVVLYISVVRTKNIIINVLAMIILILLLILSFLI